ncbi:MAG: hypothetical protein Ct9H90mP25_4150 [Gammaproteobacteria bacterium]|nr:MAG: hypothetical protein Ct9H90mP25_4150 [Gammaproteobacteria bacterium]
MGKNFVPPDVPGKVTGEIKYAEDYKARVWYLPAF